MRYLIHNKSAIGNSQQQSSFEEIIARKQHMIDRVLSHYTKLVLFEFYVSRPTPHTFKLSVTTKLKSKLLYLEDEHSNLNHLVNHLLHTLRNRINSQLIKERKDHLHQRKLHRTKTFIEYAEHLDNHYEQQENERFNHLIQNLLPALQSYILRYLRAKGMDVKIDLSLQEIKDDVYVQLFERFAERPRAYEDITAWIYRVAREYLDEYLEKQHKIEDVIDIQRLAAAELKGLEEKITVDAEGDIILVEDLDDISYQNRHLGPEIFPEDAFLDIPEEHPLSEDIKTALSTCGDMDQMIFEMYWLDELSITEIAHSMDMKESVVNEIIQNTTKKIEGILKENAEIRYKHGTSNTEH